MPYKIVDFRAAPAGTLVKHSPHYHSQHGSTPSDDEAIGIIVNLNFYPGAADADGKPVGWPEIVWEGQSFPRTSHPANVVPFRQLELPTIDMTE
jgi:hypothetical protein